MTPTTRLRLPDVVIIGAQRCGTTSLYNWLMAQTGVWDSGEPRREIGFLCFQHNWKRGPQWYANQFAGARTDEVIVEKSPVYLDHLQTPRRMKQIGLAAKFIIVMRNPVDRAYSHFHKSRAKGFEDEPDFLTAATRAISEYIGGVDDELFWLSASHIKSYVQRGFYARHLRNWFPFFQRDRFLFIKSEDMFSNPDATLADACAFIDIGYVKPRKFPRFQRLKYPPMDDGARERLTGIFRPHNAALAKLLDDERWIW